MRHVPLKVANASARISKLNFGMGEDIRTRVPKNSLITKSNTIEIHYVEINI